MPAPASIYSGFLTITLHAHLPYVVNHGTWPHGLEWLHEAAAETYLPLLRMFRRLERDGVGWRCNLNLTPVLLEQLAHPVFKAEFPHYLERKIVAAREDEAFFVSTGEDHYVSLARFWQQFFSEALNDFRSLGGCLIDGFREFEDKGMLEILTSSATHGYLPLLGTDESLRGQIQTAVATHQRHLGRSPQGVWIPECGYRPAGPWSYPVQPAGHPEPIPPMERIGVEQVLAEAGLRFFFVDTHLIEQSARNASPYERSRGPAGVSPSTGRSLYHPYLVGSTSGPSRQTAVFARDPHTGLQVWSGENGYPGDSAYLDFHKKRWPGGHRYWRVTGPAVEMADKEPYRPETAAERVRSHADHFVHTVWEALAPSFGSSRPPVLCAPFDAELFGHWWFEGIAWLEAVARILHDYATGLELIGAGDYLHRFPPTQNISMPEGSWGAGGDNQVWLNAQTSWTYSELYAAELFCREVCTGTGWSATELGVRLTKQLCRELLLLQSSDWPFLITTGAARDYAEQRFGEHLRSFQELRTLWERLKTQGRLSEQEEAQLAAMELSDNVLPDIDPRLWDASLQISSLTETAGPNAGPNVGPGTGEGAVAQPGTTSSVAALEVS